jgi:CIC family chloride channel protein
MAAMAAIVMIFEMTRDYTVVIPMTLTVAISYAVRRSVIKDSIYTRKLALWGELAPESLRGDLQFTRRAVSIMTAPLGILSAATRLQDFQPDKNEAYIVADESGAVEGAVTAESLAALGSIKPNAVIGDVAERNYVVVSPDDSVWKVVVAMRSTGAAFALVALHAGDLRAGSVKGIISRKRILDVLADDMELFGV